jgi:hypothetical protein
MERIDSTTDGTSHTDGAEEIQVQGTSTARRGDRSEGNSRQDRGMPSAARRKENGANEGDRPKAAEFET